MMWSSIFKESNGYTTSQYSLYKYLCIRFGEEPLKKCFLMVYDDREQWMDLVEGYQEIRIDE